MSINPERARQDPVIVQNVPFHKAQLQLLAEVEGMQPPPRPANWGVSSTCPNVYLRLILLNLFDYSVLTYFLGQLLTVYNCLEHIYLRY